MASWFDDLEKISEASSINKKIFELFVSLMKEVNVSENGKMILAGKPSQLEFRKAFLEQLIKFSELRQYASHIKESLINKGSNYFIGANLSILCSLLGTAYVPNFKGKILFLEECNEPLYKMERMFYQLHLAGCFKDLEELWIGTSLNAELPMDLLESFSAIYNFRLVADLPIGHGDLNFITPLF
jgi:muramoyltetrapeptide carboxypeptidase LdcA involved in peptidoglycan recycling